MPTTDTGTPLNLVTENTTPGSKARDDYAANFQKINDAVKALQLVGADLNLAGRRLGHASTFAALPAVDLSNDPAINGDWAILTADNVGTGTTQNPQYPRGIYSYNGSGFVLELSLQLPPVTSINGQVGAVSGLASSSDVATGVSTANAYTDARIQGLAIKDPVNVVATTNVNLTSPGAAVDGYSFVTSGSDSVLLAAQTDGTQNGIYIWNGPTTPLTRRADADTSIDMKPGLLVYVAQGTANHDTLWELQTDGAIILGTTSLAFGLSSGASALSPILAYNGSSYAPRSTVSSSTSTPVLWVGPVAPPVGSPYAIVGVDVWINTTELS